MIFSGKPSSLLQFKSLDLAEQMTLLDSQLFIRLDSAELILWVQEQNEDKSPNLTKFTEHFNNMSYWCRYVLFVRGLIYVFYLDLITNPLLSFFECLLYFLFSELKY